MLRFSISCARLGIRGCAQHSDRCMSCVRAVQIIRPGPVECLRAAGRRLRVLSIVRPGTTEWRFARGKLENMEGGLFGEADAESTCVSNMLMNSAAATVQPASRYLPILAQSSTVRRISRLRAMALNPPRPGHRLCSSPRPLRRRDPTDGSSPNCRR